MQRCRATESDERATADVAALICRVDAACVGHVLVDDLGNADGRNGGLQARRLCQRSGDGLGSGIDVECHRSAGESLRCQPAQHRVGVGHRGLRAAAPIGRGARFGAGAGRAHGDPPERVQAGDRTAPGADLDHLDDRQPQREPTARQEAVLAAHLEFPARTGMATLDDAQFRRRAAHVEAEGPFAAETAGDF